MNDILWSGGKLELKYIRKACWFFNKKYTDLASANKNICRYFAFKEMEE